MAHVFRTMAVEKILIPALLALSVSPVQARSWVDRSVCQGSRFYGYSRCTYTHTELPPASRDVSFTPSPAARQEEEARDAEAAKWEAYCKPVYRHDEYGIRRASYAHAGCEFGRSE
ncbi:hypothetical protein ACQR1Y_16060 [Bradyrhizobium sp. HKCCYLRH3099]|uniref:hypothetical protein n=1 Tax=unclassified Bradyrhizobium TaxID=2631580 RepID=UPI003EB98BAB